MLIIAGHVSVAPGARDEYVNAHRELVQRCRDADGCLDVAITADAVEPGRVNVFERWASQDALDAWRAIAHAPDTGIGFDAEDVQLFTVTDARPPFG